MTTVSCIICMKNALFCAYVLCLICTLRSFTSLPSAHQHEQHSLPSHLAKSHSLSMLHPTLLHLSLHRLLFLPLYLNTQYSHLNKLPLAYFITQVLAFYIALSLLFAAILILCGDIQTNSSLSTTSPFSFCIYNIILSSLATTSLPYMT